MFLTVSEAAKQLKMQPSTIKRKIKEGLIPAYRLGGLTAPVRIDADELKQIVGGLSGTRRDMEMFDKHGPKTRSEEMQYDELNRRCLKLAGIVGPDRIFELLQAFDTKTLSELHPRHYASFRGKLLRLTRGLTLQRRAA